MAESNSTTETTTTNSEVGDIVGQVKWFNNQLNYGFITVLSEGEHNGIDVFVHQTNINPQVSNYRTLTQGEYVSFNLTHNEDEKHPYHGTNVKGYGGGKLMCDFNNSSFRYQEGGGKGNRSSSQNGAFRGRGGGRGGGGRGGGRRSQEDRE